MTKLDTNSFVFAVYSMHRGVNWFLEVKSELVQSVCRETFQCVYIFSTWKTLTYSEITGRTEQSYVTVSFRVLAAGEHTG